MAAVRAGSEFDEISGVYDATREPLSAAVVQRLATTLAGWGVRDLLEVGVGTGRVAAPLAARGFEVTGVDASRGMLARARAKGIPRLVRGSAYRLPLDTGAVDAALFVHVLHILNEPAVALAEACRVSRVGAAALLRPPPAGPKDRDTELRPRRMVIELLRKDGVQLPDRASGGPPVAERRLLNDFPPDRLVTVSEEDVTEPLAEELALFERRASRWTLTVPPENLARAVATVREAVGDRTHTYHQVRALALWERPPRRRPGAVDSPRPSADSAPAPSS
jgi:ubiquinone/menaquinone biosynthesis C-methylase UbiE